MANKQVSELTDATPLAGTEILHVVKSGNSRRTTTQEVADLTSKASTTEVLTGTNTANAVTADALAALWEQGSDVASAGTISLGEGGFFNITGTTTITDIDFATDKAGRKVWVKFAGALTLTHNATTLILPGGANITTAAGDTACFVSEGSDVVRCVAYTRAGTVAVGSGSSFPASPVDGQRFFHTTHKMEFYWNNAASHWLSSHILEGQPSLQYVLLAHGASGIVARWINPWKATFKMFMEDVRQYAVLSGTGNWDVTLRVIFAGATVNTQAGITGTLDTTVAIDAIYDVVGFETNLTENSGTSTISYLPGFTYRLALAS